MFFELIEKRLRNKEPLTDFLVKHRGRRIDSSKATREGVALNMFLVINTTLNSFIMFAYNYFISFQEFIKQGFREVRQMVRPALRRPRKGPAKGLSSQFFFSIFCPWRKFHMRQRRCASTSGRTQIDAPTFIGGQGRGQPRSCAISALWPFSHPDGGYLQE